MIILGHENPDVDSIVSGILLNKIINKKGYNCKFIIPDKIINNDTYEILSNYGINPYDYMNDLPNRYEKYILVDHHERVVNGEIVCIIDHHKTLSDIDLEHYYNTDYSSTACFIAKMYEEFLDKHYYNTDYSSTACFIAKMYEEFLDKRDLELAILATMIDTVSFHSTKGRFEDEEWCKYICCKYKLNYDNLYNSGLYLTNINNLKLASLNGLKKYVIDDKKIESSYIQIKNINDNIDKINRIVDALKEYIFLEDLYLFVFIVHDMDSFKSMYYRIERNSIFERYYDKYEQRGNVIMPEIFEYVKNK